VAFASCLWENLPHRGSADSQQADRSPPSSAPRAAYPSPNATASMPALLPGDHQKSNHPGPGSARTSWDLQLHGGREAFVVLLSGGLTATTGSSMEAGVVESPDPPLFANMRISGAKWLSCCCPLLGRPRGRSFLRQCHRPGRSNLRRLPDPLSQRQALNRGPLPALCFRISTWQPAGCSNLWPLASLRRRPTGSVAGSNPLLGSEPAPAFPRQTDAPQDSAAQDLASHRNEPRSPQGRPSGLGKVVLTLGCHRLGLFTRTAWLPPWRSPFASGW